MGRGVRAQCLCQCFMSGSKCAANSISDGRTLNPVQFVQVHALDHERQGSRAQDGKLNANTSPQEGGGGSSHAHFCAVPVNHLKCNNANNKTDNHLTYSGGCDADTNAGLNTIYFI